MLEQDFHLLGAKKGGIGGDEEQAAEGRNKTNNTKQLLHNSRHSGVLLRRKMIDSIQRERSLGALRPKVVNGIREPRLRQVCWDCHFWAADLSPHEVLDDGTTVAREHLMCP